jgi:predicted TIM-barrel fold metal-dependent hydrolase
MSGAVDSHCHVFCGPELPLSEERLYTPAPCQAGTARDYRAVLDSHGITHALIVGAQAYGTDNRCLLEAIASAKGRFKGIALVDSRTEEREFQALSGSGIVGVRINLGWGGMRALLEPGADRLFAQVREMGWFVQVHCERDEFEAAAPILRRFRIRVMIDHFGRPDVTQGIDQPGFRAILDLGRDGDAVCKISGPFRCSRRGPPYDDVDPFVAAIIDAFTLERCVWGSDWPFVVFDRRVDYGPQLDCMRRWLPDQADRHRVLWENPSRLFGFAAAPRR